MWLISKQQMAEFKRHRRQAFIDAQPARLRNRYPEAFDRAFPNFSASLAFIEQLVAEASAAGVSDCANMETLLDTCLAVGWTSPHARAAAGVEAILSDTAPTGVQKVTRIVNAAAFAAAACAGLT